MSTAPASGRAISSGRQLTVTATPSGGTRIYLQQQTPSTSAASSSGGHRPNLPPQQRQTSGQSSRPSGATATASSIPVVFTAASPATKPGGSTTQGQGNPPGHRPLIPFDPDKEIKQFWPKQREKVDALTTGELRDANKAQLLPLARIKKIMKIDDDVKSQMISAEAPVLFAKACEIFIEELTLRAWVHTEDNKRKTLQKNDIAMAIAKYEQFDFLIDIVPREESKTPTTKRQPEPDLSLLTQITGNASSADPTNQVQQYYISVPGGGGGQVSLQALGTGGSSGLLQTMGSHQVQLQNGQVVQATPIGQPIQLQAVPGQTMQLIAAGDVLGGTAGQPIQLQVLPSGVQIAETGEIQTVEDEDMVDREELE